MGTAVRFYQTLSKIMEQKHKVRIELTITERRTACSTETTPTSRAQ